MAELLAIDPQYADWLAGQGWLAARFAELHAAILSRGAGTDDSPEHNALQGRFLEPLFQAAFVLAAVGTARIAQYRQAWHDSDRQPLVREIEACQHRIARSEEYCDRWGASEFREQELQALRSSLAEWQLGLSKLSFPRFGSSVSFEVQGVDVIVTWSPGQQELALEIKPSLGEDFPSVMRQMARLRAGYLLIESYTGRALSLEQVRAMFAANHRKLLTLREVEACMGEAMALLDG